MSSSAAAALGKRKYVTNHNQKNPKRGGPGVLLTCETGRERKCRHEGIDILNHYFHSKNQQPADDDNNNGKPLSLEDEIKQLQATKKEKQVFSVYETGTRGTMTLLCTLPDCALIAPYAYEKEDQPQKPEDGEEKEPDTKKVKVQEENQEEQKSTTMLLQQPPVWDPVETVRLVLDDLRKGTADAPSSRFVTRMIPIQASCFTNNSEITHTARELFASKKKEKEATFGIQVKRRICSHLNTKGVIDLVAKEAPVTWIVNLSAPKYTIIVEICKTLCGMSIIENIKEYGNFNLVETREKAAAQKADGGEAQKDNGGEAQKDNGETS